LQIKIPYNPTLFFGALHFFSALLSFGTRNNGDSNGRRILNANGVFYAYKGQKKALYKL
jgi:hypothetical protein